MEGNFELSCQILFEFVFIFYEKVKHFQDIHSFLYHLKIITLLNIRPFVV